MATSKTTLKPGDNLPGRGKSFKTLLMEVIKDESMLDLKKSSTKEDADKAFIKHIAKRAFAGNADQNSAMLLKEFLTKSYPSLKPTLERFQFTFPKDGTDSQKALAILDAISSGELPPDVGQLVMSIIKDNSVIEANTDLKDRITQIEKSLGLSVE
jgi:hypothetical protein